MFLFKNNLAYLDDLLDQLKTREEGWQERIRARIEQTMAETRRMWSEK